ncbi:hypothetical protein QBC39DRAFT_81909 [Podospora conica]|nr:hypothetical protein QBC39DRAFT_81909 [Schizothecium conicum]
MIRGEMLTMDLLSRESRGRDPSPHLRPRPATSPPRDSRQAKGALEGENFLSFGVRSKELSKPTCSIQNGVAYHFNVSVSLFGGPLKLERLGGRWELPAIHSPTLALFYDSPGSLTPIPGAPWRGEPPPAVHSGLGAEVKTAEAVWSRLPTPDSSPGSTAMKRNKPKPRTRGRDWTSVLPRAQSMGPPGRVSTRARRRVAQPGAHSSHHPWTSRELC